MVGDRGPSCDKDDKDEEEEHKNHDRTANDVCEGPAGEATVHAHEQRRAAGKKDVVHVLEGHSAHVDCD